MTWVSSFCDARAKRFHHYVDLLCQCKQSCFARLGFQVERNALFAALGIAKHDRFAALLPGKGLSRPRRLGRSRILNFNHPSAMISHVLGGRWTRQEQREVENSESVQFHSASEISR